MRPTNSEDNIRDAVWVSRHHVFSQKTARLLASCTLLDDARGEISCARIYLAGDGQLWWSHERRRDDGLPFDECALLCEQCQCVGLREAVRLIAESCREIAWRVTDEPLLEQVTAALVPAAAAE